jgi:hypothetical protein
MHNLKALHGQASINQLLPEFGSATPGLTHHVHIERPHIEFNPLSAMQLGFKPNLTQRLAA